MLVGYWPSAKLPTPFGFLVAVFSVFYTPHLTLPPPAADVIGCSVDTSLFIVGKQVYLVYEHLTLFCLSSSTL